MNRLSIALLLSLCMCSTQAAQAPAAAEAASIFRIFHGQWTFLKNSTAFCAEQVPAMKRDFERARGNVEEQMERAETIVMEETKGNREGFKPLFDTYSGAWTKYANELVAGLKKQDPRKACPDLLSNWQAADAEQILEDWRGFVDRSEPVPQVGVKSEALHGAQ